MRSLMMGFRALLKQSPAPTTTPTPIRTVTALHRWMERASASGIALIQHFESRLQGDILAVEAAVTERWSNGPVEGQVNRLKTIKRQMYGRAGVELLRARLIPLPVEPSLLQRTSRPLVRQTERLMMPSTLQEAGYGTFVRHEA